MSPVLPHHPQTLIDQGSLCIPHLNCDRALLTISLRYVMSPRRQSPICSPMDPGVQVLDLAIEVCLVVLPCQPIHTRCGISLEGEECHPETFNADMVEERVEPFLHPVPCELPYSLRRLY